MTGRLGGIILVLFIAIAVFIYLMRSGQPPAPPGLPGQPAEGTAEVVCYTALDMEFSQRILKRFEEKTGIRVRAKYDAESTKTIGLINRLVNEAEHPVCDVFWNNEIVGTLRLKQKGLLASYRPEAAQGFPNAFRDPDGCWTGFAARARVLLVNTDAVKPADMPETLGDLLNPEWKGKIGIAKPLFGSTATWAAVVYTRAQQNASGDAKSHKEILEDLASGGYLQVVGGNKQSAQNVASGALVMGFTDTDDAIIEQEGGKPVEIVYLDGAKDQAGTLFFPNTLSILKHCPHPQNARKLVEFLLSPEVELALANSPSAQIPVNPAVEAGEDFTPRVATPATVKPMEVDWDAVAANWDASVEWVKETFGE